MRYWESSVGTSNVNLSKRSIFAVSISFFRPRMFSFTLQVGLKKYIYLRYLNISKILTVTPLFEDNTVCPQAEQFNSSSLAKKKKKSKFGVKFT